MWWALLRYGDLLKVSRDFRERFTSCLGYRNSKMSNKVKSNEKGKPFLSLLLDNISLYLFLPNRPFNAFPISSSTFSGSVLVGSGAGGGGGGCEPLVLGCCWARLLPPRSPPRALPRLSRVEGAVPDCG